MSSLAGKVIIITGAGRGLGRAMAERCGREGAHIAILEIDVDLGRTSAAALAESGVEALFVEADIAQASQVENAVAQVIERWGFRDVLLHEEVMLASDPNSLAVEPQPEGTPAGRLVRRRPFLRPPPRALSTSHQWGILLMDLVGPESEQQLGL